MAKLVSASARRPRAVQVQMREPNCERLARHARTCRDQARAYAQRVNESRSVLDLLVWGHFAHEAASFRAKTIRCPENLDDPPTACVLPEPNVDAERGDVGAVWRFLDHELGVAGGLDAGDPGLWEMAMCAGGITRHTNRKDLNQPFKEFKNELSRHDEERRLNGGVPLIDWILSRLHDQFPTVTTELPRPCEEQVCSTAMSITPHIDAPAKRLKASSTREEEQPVQRWLTSTEAAERLRDVTAVPLQNARIYVSRAAKESPKHFRTNGKSRAALRIDLHTFSVWLLTQREKYLDKEDQ